MSDMSFSEETHYREKFTGLSVTDETLNNRTFEECTFDTCSFINTKLARCRFLSCRFKDCTLSAVTPMDSRFIEVSFANCKVIGIDWTKTQQFQDIAFKNCQLNFSNFRLMKIPKIIMPDCEVKDSDFGEADLSSGDFKNTDFEKTRFFKTNLTGADFKGARNYFIDIKNNNIKKAKFSYPDVLTLLNSLDIIIE